MQISFRSDRVASFGEGRSGGERERGKEGGRQKEEKNRKTGWRERKKGHQDIRLHLCSRVTS